MIKNNLFTINQKIIMFLKRLNDNLFLSKISFDRLLIFIINYKLNIYYYE